MNSESLISALTSIPVEVFDFDEVSFEDDHHDDNESIDSLGSCCNSPNQSSDGSFSPNPTESSSCDESSSSYFIFPTNSSCDGPKPINSTPKLEGAEKGKRKMECKVKRNERERRRVRRLADGFRKLREVVPGNYKKLSKLDTLKRALDYMSGLSDLLQMHASSQSYGHDSFYENSATFIKQEPEQFSPEYHPYQVPVYPNSTINYPPSSEWSMYTAEKAEPIVYHGVPTMGSYCTPQRLIPY